ncbi:hypothetical protein BKA70DRAFT_1237234 [Coprinopsis sp. MPI-PUGE-AT-0042]|nr:hypothetical protein BKA70DRAFT_1237234 [Coprinopsis sp. MPI-PUGE-AT-0042]
MIVTETSFRTRKMPRTKISGQFKTWTRTRGAERLWINKGIAMGRHGMGNRYLSFHYTTVQDVEAAWKRSRNIPAFFNTMTSEVFVIGWKDVGPRPTSAAVVEEGSEQDLSSPSRRAAIADFKPTGDKVSNSAESEIREQFMIWIGGGSKGVRQKYGIKQWWWWWWWWWW